MTLLSCPVALLALALPTAAAAPPNRLPAHLPPEIYAWFWQEDEFRPEGYRRFVDLIAEHSNFGLLTTSLRTPAREIALAETHDQVKRAVAYAHSRGLRVAFDLDARLARGAFLARYPGQQQGMLRVRRLEAGKRLTIEPHRLSDHMTASGGAYEALSGRLAGAFTLSLEPAPVRVISASARGVTVESNAAGDVLVAALFEHRTPDVFAPALLDFQNALYEQYRDVPLDGGMKDEWGFPPVNNRGPREGDFWHSEAFAKAYRAAGGGDLVRDSALMFAGAPGREAERAAAVNRYARLILERNAAIERHFYESVKRIWGKNAFVGTHATWGIMPTGDAFKNGYDWWQAPRDFGQTDEDWPYPIRTSLAKKWRGPVWFNQYYNSDPAAYASELWKAARNGGRINFHPLYPSVPRAERDLALLRSPALRAETRIRLLNYIARAPIDSPVAVVFGHAAALNWVEPHFADLGLEFADELARLGYRADVIPSTEIHSGALRVERDWVAYGAQRYRALVFLNRAHEPRDTGEFLRRAASTRTLVFERGGAPIPGVYAATSPGRVARWLGGSYTAHPLQPADLAMLTDGTCLLARGEHDPAGDPIDAAFVCGGRRVTARATGVFAIRLRGSGEIEALAASELRRLEVGAVKIELKQPTDVALWRNAKGEMEGMVQRAAEVPAELRGLASRWSFLGSIP
jgi:hypothetical protein